MPSSPSSRDTEAVLSKENNDKDLNEIDDSSTHTVNGAEDVDHNRVTYLPKSNRKQIALFLPKTTDLMQVSNASNNSLVEVERTYLNEFIKSITVYPCWALAAIAEWFRFDVVGFTSCFTSTNLTQ